MPVNPELEDFRRRVEDLRSKPQLVARMKGDVVELAALTLDEVHEVIQSEEGYYFLLAAAGLNRTTLKRAVRVAEAGIVSEPLRRAFAIRSRLPVRASFQDVAGTAVAHRQRDLGRKLSSQVEQLFRERLAAEGIPLVMSPPIRRVPGLLISQRKPDGVYPDPATGKRPLVYLEVKNIKRVSDDIQKRLYEIAEAALEMKTLYGDLHLVGLGVRATADVPGNEDLRRRVREQILASPPTVVAFFICPGAEAERYRAGAETFIDGVFFQEQVDECLSFIRGAVDRWES